MTKQKEDKLDEVLASLFKDEGLESPSSNFTSKVLQQARQSVASQPEPLISKTGWFVIGIVMISLTVIGSVLGSGKSYLPEASIDISISPTVGYASALFLIMTLITTVWAKHNHNRHWTNS